MEAVLCVAIISATVVFCVVFLGNRAATTADELAEMRRRMDQIHKGYEEAYRLAQEANKAASKAWDKADAGVPMPPMVDVKAFAEMQDTVSALVAKQALTRR